MDLAGGWIFDGGCECRSGGWLVGLGSGAWLRTQEKRASVGKNGLSFLALRASIPRVGRRIFEMFESQSPWACR